MKQLASLMIIPYSCPGFHFRKSKSITKYQQPATDFLLVTLKNGLVNLYLFSFQKIKINKEESLLNTGQQSEYALIQEMIYRKEPFDKLWKTAVTFHSYHDKWMNGPLIEVNAEEVEEEVGMWGKYVNQYVSY